MRTTTLCGLLFAVLASAGPASFAAEIQFQGHGQGKITGMEMILAAGAPGELMVREPSMCGGRAESRIQWNRGSGKVKLRGKFWGLPFRPNLAYAFDPSNALNQWPASVENGAWQYWIVGIGTRTSTYHYDAAGQLLGSELDDIDPQDIATTVTDVPVVHMLCTDFFETDLAAAASGESTTVHFTFDYDAMLDVAGTAGVYAGFVPFDLTDPDNTLRFHYTEGGLDPSLAMSWDEILAVIESGFGGLGLGTSYEPVPKPELLLARDNLMIGWSASYPPALIEGFQDPNPPGDCGTYQLPLPPGLE